MTRYESDTERSITRIVVAEGVKGDPDPADAWVVELLNSVPPDEVPLSVGVRISVLHRFLASSRLSFTVKVEFDFISIKIVVACRPSRSTALY